MVRGSTIGEELINDKRLPLVSFTGSTAMGKRVSEVVGKRLGRTILELGGNNAIIVDETADMDMVIPATMFGAVGTAGQRCTSTRRIIIQENLYDGFVKKLVNAYKQVKIGDPIKSETLMGPVVNESTVEVYKNAINKIKETGGEILYGGNVIEIRWLLC